MELHLTPAGDLAVGTARAKLAAAERLTGFDHAMLALGCPAEELLANAERFAPTPEEIPSAFVHLLAGMRGVGQNMAEGKKIASHKGAAIIRWRRSMLQREDFDARQKGWAFRILAEREGHAAAGFSAYGCMESTLESAAIAASDTRQDAGSWIEQALADGMPRHLMANNPPGRLSFPARHVWLPETDSRSGRDPQWRLARIAFEFGWDPSSDAERWLVGAILLDSEKWRRFDPSTGDPEALRRDLQWNDGFDSFCSWLAPADFTLSPAKHVRLLNMAVEGVASLHALFIRHAWYPLAEWSRDPPNWLARELGEDAPSPIPFSAFLSPRAMHAPEIAGRVLALREATALDEAVSPRQASAPPTSSRL